MYGFSILSVSLCFGMFKVFAKVEEREFGWIACFSPLTFTSLFLCLDWIAAGGGVEWSLTD
jgi:hypothetical protein